MGCQGSHSEKLEESSLLGLLVKDLTELSHRFKKRFNDLDNDHWAAHWSAGMYLGICRL